MLAIHHRFTGGPEWDKSLNVASDVVFRLAEYEKQVLLVFDSLLKRIVTLIFLGLLSK